MANIKIVKFNYFETDVTNDNREFDFNANVVYKHNGKLKFARLDLNYANKTASLSKDQHGQKPHRHSSRLLAAVEVVKGWR